MSVRVSVVVVTHNSAEAVAGLDGLRGPDEIIFVDNASQDHTVEAIRHALPAAQVIANADNRGFAAAVNQGVRASNADVIVLLNPDAQPRGPLDASAPIVRRALDPKIGVVGGKLLGVEGDVQTGFNVRAFPSWSVLALESLGVNRLWPSNPANRRYRMTGFDHAQPQACEQPAGAFLAFRRGLFDELQGFDERFWPLWFEDVDFCLRASASGYSNWFEPASEAVHLGAHSIASLGLPEKRKYWYRSLLRFAKKHFGPPSAASLQAIVAIGLLLRGLAAGCIGRQAERRACFEVMRMTVRGSIFSDSADREHGRESAAAGNSANN